MYQVSDDEFTAIVSEEYNAIPGDVFQNLDNVVVLIENQPAGQLPRLFGLYTGFPLGKRGHYGMGQMPDRITLYQDNIESSAHSLEQLRRRIRITLIHEIGHHYGMTDARLGELGWA